MSAFYDDMQQTSTELLTEFNQGVISYVPLVDAVNEWDTPSDGTPVPLDATAKGVSQKYITDLITGSDIEVTCAVIDPAPQQSGVLVMDGKRREIIAVKQIPAAGTPVAYKIFVKG